MASVLPVSLIFNLAMDRRWLKYTQFLLGTLLASKFGYLVICLIGGTVKRLVQRSQQILPNACLHSLDPSPTCLIHCLNQKIDLDLHDG